MIINMFPLSTGRLRRWVTIERHAQNTAGGI